ncbi:DUF2057 domain-containing protein [Pseudomonas sp. R5(2019)]|uniref:DUF2057 domain-containing protein n=1 Tax=Pseudomonas sp. R5(2019) TaxID=2697566 RepID=UPI0014136827|nr:DUF2057 domain-containing protein [Pseudomonas sp. R5(2019)]NBA96984.1 hypothetical protein [Pseudomonas sp. R5(2019)]
MRQPLILLALGLLSACASPLPPVDPQKAWVDMFTYTGKLVMAERLDKQRLKDGRYFQVTPGQHELIVRFDFEVNGGTFNNDPIDRTCYLTIRYDNFEAGQRYRLEGREVAMQPSARLYNAAGKIVAEDRATTCL